MAGWIEMKKLGISCSDPLATQRSFSNGKTERGDGTMSSSDVAAPFATYN